MLNIVRWVLTIAIGLILCPILFVIYVILMIALLCLLLLEVVGGLDLERASDKLFAILDKSFKVYGKILKKLAPSDAFEIET